MYLSQRQSNKLPPHHNLQSRLATMGAGASVLPHDMGPYLEREQIRWIPFVGIRTFAASRIPPDHLRHLFAPESDSVPEDYDEDYDYEYAHYIDPTANIRKYDGAVEHWLSNMDEHLE